MNNDIERILYSQSDLDGRMDEMAADLNVKYRMKSQLLFQS